MEDLAPDLVSKVASERKEFYCQCKFVKPLLNFLIVPIIPDFLGSIYTEPRGAVYS
jgi:hypothetical protein